MPPLRKVLMIERILILISLFAGLSKEVAQLGSSRDCFSEVECNIVRHLHCFSSDDACQAKQVLDGKSLWARIFAGPMADQPGDYRSCVLLITHVDFEKT